MTVMPMDRVSECDNFLGFFFLTPKFSLSVVKENRMILLKDLLKTQF